MPANVGNQIVTILYYRAANSSIVNKRHKGIRQVGIYSGGYLSIVDASNAQLATLICEISDSTHQVRVETGSAINIAVALATPYVVLRWAYTGAITDYMEIKVVATPAANDVVVGKCTFTGGGDLQGFDYGDSDYPRTTPGIQDLFLKVEATPDTELRVRVRAGRIQSASGVYDVADQKSDLFVVPGANSRVYLVYIDTSDGTVKINSTGVAAVSPTAPDYGGQVVLAEVTLASTDTNITVDKIKDVRNFITPFVQPDDITLEKKSDGRLQVKDDGIGDDQLGNITSIFGTRTNKDTNLNALAWNVTEDASVTAINYKAQCDGSLTVAGITNWETYLAALVKIGGVGSWILLTAEGSNAPGGYAFGLEIDLAKDDLVAICSDRSMASISGRMYWLPIGSGGLVKQ